MVHSVILWACGDLEACACELASMPTNQAWSALHGHYSRASWRAHGSSTVYFVCKYKAPHEEPDQASGISVNSIAHLHSRSAAHCTTYLIPACVAPEAQGFVGRRQIGPSPRPRPVDSLMRAESWFCTSMPMSLQIVRKSSSPSLRSPFESREHIVPLHVARAGRAGEHKRS